MTEKPTYRIDGAAFGDLSGFYDEVGEQLLRGEPWGRSLDAFEDVLRGEIGPLPSEFRIVWEHSGLSHEQLGATGRGSFMELLEIIARHPNVELILS
jgi:RNAse (barnase) inhibitor barstar